MNVSQLLPSVACVCLTRNRPQMLEQAVRSFEAQTYGNKLLFVYDNGDDPEATRGIIAKHPHIYYRRAVPRPITIGELRNEANSCVRRCGHFEFGCEVIAHWDDDDYSGPGRIAAQVEQLMTTKADVVGYNDVLFWRTPQPGIAPGEAYRYHSRQNNYAIGSSLCYWARTWHLRPFKKQPTNPAASGEDSHFIQDLNCWGFSADPLSAEPLMICRVHGGNSADYSNLWHKDPRMRGSSFERLSQADGDCVRILES